MTIFNGIKLALGLGLLGAGGYFAWSYHDLAEQAATADARIATAEKNYADLKAQVDTLSEETVRRNEFDRTIRDVRASVSHNLDTVTREDPVARDYLGERLPRSVREAIRSASDMRSTAETDGH